MPPQTKIVPPKRGLCPEEINRLGATGVQIEVQIGVFGGLTPSFWDEDLFIFEITCFRPEKPLENFREELFFLENRLNFRFRRENPLQFNRRFFFFFGDHLFSAGKAA